MSVSYHEITSFEHNINCGSREEILRQMRSIEQRQRAELDRFMEIEKEHNETMLVYSRMFRRLSEKL